MFKILPSDSATFEMFFQAQAAKNGWHFQHEMFINMRVCFAIRLYVDTAAEAGFLRRSDITVNTIPASRGSFIYAVYQDSVRKDEKLISHKSEQGPSSISSRVDS